MDEGEGFWRQRLRCSSGIPGTDTAPFSTITCPGAASRRLHAAYNPMIRHQFPPDITASDPFMGKLNRNISDPLTL
jgi:hypothetical protein